MDNQTIIAAQQERRAFRAVARCALLCLLLAGRAGAAWGPAQYIITPSYTSGGSWTASNNARSLAVAGDTLFLVWTYSWANTGHQVMYKYFDGSSWRGDSTIGYLGNWRAHDWYPSCAADPAGRLHAVWECGEYESGTGYDLSYTSIGRGGSSGQQHLVSSPSNTWHPVIAATSDSRMYVCWQDDRSGGFKLEYKFLDGSTWSGDLAVADSAVYASFPSLAACGTGLGLVWQDYRSGTSQIHFTEYAGGAWGTDSAVSHSTQGAFAPSLACDQAGNFHVVWEDWRDGNSGIYYRRYDRAGHSWDPEVRLTDQPWRSREPMVVCRGDTLADVFWADDCSGSYRVISRQALRGAWGAESTLTSGWADQRCPAAAADARGNLYLVWTDFNIPTLAARPGLYFMSNIINPWPKGDAGAHGAGPVRQQLALQVHPNPARQQAMITFSSAQPTPEAAIIRIYAITGQLVRTIISRAAATGTGGVLWDCADQSGRRAASGVYVITLAQGSGSAIAKLTVVR